MPRKSKQNVDGQGLWIEWIRLDRTKPDKRNPKDHDLGLLDQSFDRFGFIAPGAINEVTGKLIYGHGRWKRLIDRHKKGLAPPSNVRIENDGMWSWPVIRGIRLSDDEGLAYMIADNRVVELGGWNEPVLVKTLIKIASDQPEAGLFGTGFSPDELDSMAGFLHGTLEDLEKKFGVPMEKDFWPLIHLRVPPKTFAKFQRLMGKMPGDDEAQKFDALISRRN